MVYKSKLTLKWITSLLTNGYIAQVALPARKTFGLALFITNVVTVLALHCRQLTRLLYKTIIFNKRIEIFPTQRRGNEARNNKCLIFRVYF